MDGFSLAAAGGILLITFFLRRFLVHWLLRRGTQALFHWNRGNGDFSRALEAPLSAFVLLCGFYGAARFVFPDGAAIGRYFHGIFFLLLAWVLVCVCDFSLDGLCRRARDQKTEYSAVLSFLRNFFRVLIGAAGVLLLLNCLGISVAGTFTTLGIGGALIAFAAKDSVANIFGSLSLVLDRPFRVGDWIILRDGSVDGSVEQIGLRSTRVRSHDGTLVTVPNALLTNASIDNWSRMGERRVRQLIPIAANATAAQLNALALQVEEVLREDEDVRRCTTFCALSNFEPSAIQVTVQYFTIPTDLIPHMRVRHRINCAILEIIHRLGLSVSTPLEMWRNLDQPSEEPQRLDSRGHGD